LEELQQLHARGVIEQSDSNKLSQNEKSSALEYLMFLKKKRLVNSMAGDVLMDANSVNTQTKRMHGQLQ